MKTQWMTRIERSTTPRKRRSGRSAVVWMALATAAAQTRMDLRTQARNVDFSAASSTKPSKTGTALPVTCSVGETFLKTDAAVGKNLYICTLTNTWTVQAGGLPDAQGNTDKVLSSDGATTLWRALSGDASGRPEALTVTRIQGRAVAGTNPANGQALTWNSGAAQWEGQSPAFAQLTGAVTDAQVSSGINASKIGAGAVSNGAFGYLANVTSDIQAQFGGKAPAAHSHTAGGDVGGDLGGTTVLALRNRAIAATAPVNGQTLVWNTAAAQWQPQNPSAGVASIFGRTGAVTAQSGDYTFGQIGGTATDAQLSGGINANKIGGGAVGNTVFGYLANVSGDIQAQFAGKAGLAHSHTAAGDVSGDLGATMVSALRNRPLASITPSNGQVLTWNTGNNQWEPQNVTGGGGGAATGGAYASSFTAQSTVTIAGTAHQLGTANMLVGCYDANTPAMRVQPNTVAVHPSTYDVTITFAAAQSGKCVVSSGGGGGSGGGGASMGVQLGDFNVTRTSATVLTVGSNCSVATPCNVRVGSRVYSFLSSTPVTVTAGTGTLYVYVDALGTLTAGHNVTLTCGAPCSAQAGVTGFPVNSIPFYTWTATNGAWDAGAGLDKRALLSSKVVSAGAGITTLDTGSTTAVSVDTALVPMYLTASATLDFGPIATGTCAADRTLSLPGAAVGDGIAAGWPGSLEAGLIGNMRVSAQGTVAVRLCNFSGGTVDPASATYRSTIVRTF